MDLVDRWQPQPADAAWAAYISAAYGSPLDIAARTGGMSLAEIANEVGCDLITAQKLRQTSWEFTAKYTHSEMPRAVAVEAAVEDESGACSSNFSRRPFWHRSQWGLYCMRITLWSPPSFPMRVDPASRSCPRSRP